jgi:hypothetical protein
VNSPGFCHHSMEKGNLKTERPYLSIEDRAFLFLSPLTPSACRQGWQVLINKSLCFEDENDFQPDPVFKNLRIFHCHPHFNNA